MQITSENSSIFEKMLFIFLEYIYCDIKNSCFAKFSLNANFFFRVPSSSYIFFASADETPFFSYIFHFPRYVLITALKNLQINLTKFCRRRINSFDLLIKENRSRKERVYASLLKWKDKEKKSSSLLLFFVISNEFRWGESCRWISKNNP